MTTGVGHCLDLGVLHAGWQGPAPWAPLLLPGHPLLGAPLSPASFVYPLADLLPPDLGTSRLGYDVIPLHHRPPLSSDIQERSGLAITSAKAVLG